MSFLACCVARFESLAYFSSIGPTSDGRLKPDIIAPGTTVSAAPQWALTSAAVQTCFMLVSLACWRGCHYVRHDHLRPLHMKPKELDSLWDMSRILDAIKLGNHCRTTLSATSCLDYRLSFMRGTSMSTPVAAAAALLVRQYFSDGWYPTKSPVPSNRFNASGALLKAMLVGQLPSPSGYPLNGAQIELWRNQALERCNV